MVLYSTICNNLWYRIDDLEKEASKRGDAMSALEAKMFYDDLTSIHDKMTAYETEMEETLTDASMLSNMLHNYRLTHIKALNLKINLTKIFSKAESTPATQNEPAKSPERATNLDSQIRKQRFLIRQIESLEIPEDTCAIKADVLCNQLSQLYAVFISNQMEIEVTLGNGSILDEQQKIAKEIQQKMIDLHTKLKKIMRSVESTSLAGSTTSSQLIQQTNTEATFLDLLKNHKSLLKQIRIPEEDICSETVKVMCDYLSSLYEASSSTQSKAFQPEKINSPELENYLQPTDLKLSDLVTSCKVLLNISTSLEHHLEISKDIQYAINSFEKVLKLSINDIEELERCISDKLDNIEEAVKDSKDREMDILDRLHELRDLEADCENQGKDTLDRLDNIESFMNDGKDCEKEIIERLVKIQDNIDDVVKDSKDREKNVFDKLVNI